jgi:pentatricopeptide repeat protein
MLDKGVMSLMAKAQVAPDHGTYTRVMMACGAHGELSRSFLIWKNMWVGKRWPRNIQSYAALMTSLVRAGQPERAIHHFMKMRKDRILPTIGLLQTILTPMVNWPRVGTQVQTWLTRFNAITGGVPQLANEQLPRTELAQLELFIRYSLGPDIQLSRLAVKQEYLRQQAALEANQQNDHIEELEDHADRHPPLDQPPKQIST